MTLEQEIRAEIYRAFELPGAPSFRVLGERVGGMELDFKMKNLDV
jgi:glutaredoxin-related protein